jgi:hypothetical protein
MILKLLFAFIFSYSALASEGNLNLFFFKDGLPLKEKEAVLNGKIKVNSNRDGHIFHSLSIGKHFLEFKNNHKIESISFYIGNSEDTEILINLFSNSNLIDSSISEPNIPFNQKSLEKGVLSGKLVTPEGRPIGGARVFIQGIDKKVTTNENGEYRADIPEGRYIVSFVHNEFSTQSLQNISVFPSKVTENTTKLLPTGLELQEFVVIAPHIKGSLSALIEVRKNSSKVADVLGSEQISKAGDSDAASSLKRVTGLTIVDGKYVYIRGLGERYSNVLMNGSSVPSPDPSRRVVQLDLFPSGILQSLVVQKSYSPDLPGSFGGGTVVLKTKDIPDDFAAKVSVGTSYASGNSKIRNGRSGSKDWLGMDDGTRKLPDSIKSATQNGRRLSQKSKINPDGFTQGELKQFSKDMPRNYNISEERAQLPPSISVSIGDLRKHKGKKFGYLMSGLYSNSWDNDNKEKFSYKSDGSEDNQHKISSSKQTVKLSGMLNLGVNLGKFAEISSNTILLRKTTNKITEDVKSSESDSDANLKRIATEWQERQLFNQSLRGKHQLGKNKKRIFSWNASLSEAKRYQPDSSSYEQDFQNGTYVTSTAGKRNEKKFNNVLDRNQDYSVKVELPIYKNTWTDFLVKAGGQYTWKKRISESQRFKYGQISPDKVKNITGDDNILEKSIEDICSDDVINAQGCLLEDTTDASDRYNAKQTISAYFIDTESKFFDFLRLNLGFRHEKSEQEILTYHGVDREEIQSGLLMQDILPVASTTVFLPLNMQLRLAYSETVSRPDFKDLNPGSYYDDEKERSVNGNLDLKGTIIKNWDARLEWYFGKNENFSIGYFRKEFFNPIEEVAGKFDNDKKLVFSESTYQLANVGNAKADGFEIEARKNFTFISNRLEFLYFGANYSSITSEMDIFPNLTAQVTNQNRPLQGQSPYIFNVNLAFDDPDMGTTATLLLNVFGRRIDAVGTKPFGDVYEEPFEQLDFVFSQKFAQKNSIKLKLKNILNPIAQKTEDGRIKEIFRKGRSGSFSFTRTF